MKAIVLFSGGLDSTTCLAMVIDKYGKENVIALSLYYGQKHSKELECAEKISKHYGVNHIKFDVSKIFESSNCSLLTSSTNQIPEKSYDEQLKETKGQPVTTYVPYRNGLFLSIAASIAISNDCQEIYYAAHKDDAAGNAYPDCSADFNETISKAIFIGSGNAVNVKVPFINMNKADIVKQGLKIGVPYEMTWSCYNGKEKPCGKCGTCLDRIKAFETNETKDPLQYEV